MTEQVQKEEQANPYNMKKSWHTDVEDKEFISADDGLFFQKITPKSNQSVKTEIDPKELDNESLEVTSDQPYKKPDYKKRYDDLKKHYDSKLNEFKSREQELLEEVTRNKTEYTAPKTEEELEQFKTEYPDVYEVVETVAHMQSESKAKVLEERLQKLQEREQEILRIEAEKRLTDRHPDFDDIRNSDDFHSWAKEQPKSIQDWIYKNADDADLASRALDLFKKDFGIDVPQKEKSNSKQTKKSAADMVSTKTTTVEPKQEKIWSETEIAAMSMDEFDRHEAEISEAMIQGRIVK
jgi:predicted house-cleaning noncanonical NTP pyrophosphatase (MazG superfamily)